MLPVFMKVIRGMVEREALTTVAAVAREVRVKMFPAEPKGTQDWQYVWGAQPVTDARPSCFRAAVMSDVTRRPEWMSNVPSDELWYWNVSLFQSRYLRE